MKVIFCGAQPGIGTSANLSAVVCGLSVMYSIPVRLSLNAQEFFHSVPESLNFFDAGGIKGEMLDKLLYSSDIIVLNTSQAGSGLDQFYLDHRMVHSNVILLVGKYHKTAEDNLTMFERQYRMDTKNICTVPFNMRFQRAYENDRMLSYIRDELRFTGNWENQKFLEALLHTLFVLRRYLNVERREIYG